MSVHELTLYCYVLLQVIMLNWFAHIIILLV